MKFVLVSISDPVPSWVGYIHQTGVGNMPSVFHTLEAAQKEATYCQIISYEPRPLTSALCRHIRAQLKANKHPFFFGYEGKRR